MRIMAIALRWLGSALGLLIVVLLAAFGLLQTQAGKTWLARTIARTASSPDFSVTIEGLGANGRLDPLQRAFLEKGAVQCGFCIPGMIMAAAALLANTPKPTDADIDASISNICRCGTYNRIRSAIHRAAEA